MKKSLICNETIEGYLAAIKHLEILFGNSQNDSICGKITDRNILEDSYKLVKDFLDIPLWEYRITSFNEKLCIKGSNSELSEREMFY